jgi:hypothetical protein
MNLLNIKGVVGYGDGYKKSKGLLGKIRNFYLKSKDKTSIIVFVEKKLPEAVLSKEDIIPKEIDGRLTDVVEIGELWSQNRTKHRPIVGGVSACNLKGTACTSGIKVYKGDKPYSLMNYHCVYGTDWGGQKGDKVIQPSRLDGGKEEDLMGYADEFIPLDSEICDSALVDLTQEMQGVKDIDYEPIVKTPYIGQQLHKSGRTTGYTKGKVLATNVVATVNYRQPDGSKRTYTFRNQIFTDNIQPFIDGGDSSSIAFEGKYPVAQIFAAGPTIGVLTPLQIVLDKLKVSLSPENPIEGFVALNSNWSTDRKTLVNLNLRSEPKIGNNIIKTLPAGTNIEIIEWAGYQNNYHWLKIKIY